MESCVTESEEHHPTHLPSNLGLGRGPLDEVVGFCVGVELQSTTPTLSIAAAGGSGGSGDHGGGANLGGLGGAGAGDNTDATGESGTESTGSVAAINGTDGSVALIGVGLILP